MAASAAAYRELVASLLHGGLAALALAALARIPSGRRRAPAARAAPARVVVVGGGFAGVGAARRFERLAVRAGAPDVTLVSESNFLLFTPMLAEAASGALEPAHISAPVRAAAGRTRFRQGRVTGVDTETRLVHLRTPGGEDEEIGYDELVLALGSVPRFLDLPGVEEHAFTLKVVGSVTAVGSHCAW